MISNGYPLRLRYPIAIYVPLISSAGSSALIDIIQMLKCCSCREGEAGVSRTPNLKAPKDLRDSLCFVSCFMPYGSSSSREGTYQLS